MRQLSDELELRRMTEAYGVSVVICTYDGRDRIVFALEHLVRQKARNIPWEIIVVANACTDGTAQYVAQ